MKIILIYIIKIVVTNMIEHQQKLMERQKKDLIKNLKDARDSKLITVAFDMFIFGFGAIFM
jgi:high-affinity Fe2+/Pb2+ permease